MKGHTFTPFASLSEEFAQNSVTCTAPSKSFNLAGLHSSNLITPNPDLKAKVDGEIGASGLFGISPFSAEATIAAYNCSGDWLDQALEYIEGNYHFLANYVSEHIPELNVLPLEGTYLAWIDCRKLGLDKDQLEDLMLNKAGIYFDEGYIFGEEGEGFERINLACPRSIVEDAARRLAKVVSDLR
jgi:cystathionine beta-lyase